MSSDSFITDETMKAHSARWFEYTCDADGNRVLIPLKSSMRGVNAMGYEVKCVCGWETKTGGGTRKYTANELYFHRFQEQGRES